MSGTTKCLAIGAVALVVTLAGGSIVGSQSVSAQAPWGGPGGRGRFGGPGGPMGRGGPGVLGPMMLGRLDLGDAQREHVKQILDGHRDEQKTLGDRARVAHEALDAATTADAFDEGGIRARAAELALVEADMAVANARLYSEIFPILTGDQQSQLKKMQADMRDHRARMQQNLPHGGQRH